MATLRRLNYQHLLYFWSVVRTGSLTRACEELALSAPTISAQLRTLEERIGEKLLAKSGRTLVPTEVGRLVYHYADQIFTLGNDLLEALEHRPSARPLRLVVGIDDVVPKEVAYRILKPTLALKRPVRLVCREGTLERLVADLAVHEIDVVLSDAPVTPSLNVRAYSHSLGTCEALWMATPALAKTLRRGFPKSLDGVPVLLPTDDTAIRRSLDQWLEKQDVHPVMIGEFEDYAMLREFARAGHGFAPVPAILEDQFRREYGFARVGVVSGINAEFYAISVERKIKNPAVAAMTENAREAFLGS
ncbi:MAG TPA: LysR family transcriptional regulator [Steroidobacteraceae bacterium]|nr:LysR family transcriptional regulator [Steroidobacteraceae bacterium]